MISRSPSPPPRYITIEQDDRRSLSRSPSPVVTYARPSRSPSPIASYVRLSSPRRTVDIDEWQRPMDEVPAGPDLAPADPVVLMRRSRSGNTHSRRSRSQSPPAVVLEAESRRSRSPMRLIRTRSRSRSRTPPMPVPRSRSPTRMVRSVQAWCGTCERPPHVVERHSRSPSRSPVRIVRAERRSRSRSPRVIQMFPGRISSRTPPRLLIAVSSRSPSPCFPSRRSPSPPVVLSDPPHSVTTRFVVSSAICTLLSNQLCFQLECRYA